MMRRGRNKNTNTTNESATSPLSIKNMLRESFSATSHKESSAIESEKGRIQVRKNKTKNKKDATSSSQSKSLIPDVQHIPLDLPIPYVQISDGEPNDSVGNNLSSNTKKNQDMDDEVQFSARIKRRSLITNPKKTSAKPITVDVLSSDEFATPPDEPATPPDEFATPFETASSSIKRKKPSEFRDPPTKSFKYKSFKYNANVQSILEKILVEQLNQRNTIEALQENCDELKREILENRKLIQNMLTILTAGSFATEQTQQQQGEKPKQRLKRKDTRHMWWDVPMTETCLELFQSNKNPSDVEIEQAFKSKIQSNYPQKMQEISNLDGWDNLWKAVYSIILEYFRNHRSNYVRKIKETVYAFFNLFPNKLDKFASPEEVKCWKESEKFKKARRRLWNKLDDNKLDSPYIIEAILQRVFNKEELRNMDNIIYGVTVTLMLLDPTYDQTDISSFKVQERMNKWDTNPAIQRWLEHKNLPEDNTKDLKSDNDSYESDQESNLKENEKVLLEDTEMIGTDEASDIENTSREINQEIIE